ncbi:hypothetical protein Tco_0760790 [Tanacetum coccineum]
MVAREADDGVNDIEFGGESGNIGKLPLLEWNKSSQVGKGGTVFDNDFCVFDSNNEFSLPWSTKIMITNRKKTLIGDFEFRKLLYYDTDDSASFSEGKGILETWFGVKEVDQDIYVEWKDDPYHLVDELEDTGEINDMFAELDQAIDELDQVIEAEGVTDLLAVYDQTINDEEDVVQVEVVAEEMVTKEAVDVMMGVGPVDDGDVIPDEVVTEINARDQT